MTEVNVREINMVWKEPQSPPKEVIRWCIQNFVNVPREKDVPLRSTSFLIQGLSYVLELFPGGMASSSDGDVALTLTRISGLNVYGMRPSKLNFNISIRNQLDEKNSITRVAPPNSEWPNQADTRTTGESRKARIGWEDFVGWSKLVDPKQGFVVLGELIVEAEIVPCAPEKGELAVTPGPKLEGSSLSDDIKSLWSSKSSSDVLIVAGGKEFSVHRSILAARSPVLRSMFSTGMAEASTATVEITDISPEALEILLEFLYTDSFARQDAEPQLTGDVLKAARKYEVPRLASLCEARAMTAINVESVAEWLMLAVMVGAEQLKAACMRFLKVHCAEVQCTAGWRRLTADRQLASEVMPCLLELLCPPAKRARSE